MFHLIRNRAWNGLLLFSLLSGSPLLSQAQTNTAAPNLTMSSAIVGATSTQSAQLNVLNLAPVIPGVTAVACPATLEFYSASGALLKQMSVNTIAPSTAVSLVFKPSPPSTAVNARAQIRAVVVMPFPIVTPVVSSGSTPVIPVGAGCTFVSSLEITDDSSGVTQILTTDFRSTPEAIAVVTPGMK